MRAAIRAEPSRPALMRTLSPHAKTRVDRGKTLHLASPHALARDSMLIFFI
jgi:hypothetical protein